MRVKPNSTLIFPLFFIQHRKIVFKSHIAHSRALEIRVRSYSERLREMSPKGAPFSPCPKHPYPKRRQRYAKGALSGDFGAYMSRNASSGVDSPSQTDWQGGRRTDASRRGPTWSHRRAGGRAGGRACEAADPAKHRNPADCFRLSIRARRESTEVRSGGGALITSSSGPLAGSAS